MAGIQEDNSDLWLCWTFQLILNENQVRWIKLILKFAIMLSSNVPKNNSAVEKSLIVYVKHQFREQQTDNQAVPLGKLSLPKQRIYPSISQNPPDDQINLPSLIPLQSMQTHKSMCYWAASRTSCGHRLNHNLLWLSGTTILYSWSLIIGPSQEFKGQSDKGWKHAAVLLSRLKLWSCCTFGPVSEVTVSYFVLQLVENWSFAAAFFLCMCFTVDLPIKAGLDISVMIWKFSCDHICSVLQPRKDGDLCFSRSQGNFPAN